MNDDVATIIRQQAPFVWRALRHLGVPPAQLEDLSQEVFIVMWRNLVRFRGDSALTTWIYGICRNVAWDVWRKRKRSREQPHGQPPEPPVAETQTPELARREHSQRLHEALQALPESTRMVFVLYEIESMDMADVAAAVGCTPSTAYSRLYSARDRLRRGLTRAGVIESDQDLAEVM